MTEPNRSEARALVRNSGVNVPFYRACRQSLRWMYRFIWGWETIGMDRIPSTGPVILASNHASFLDPPILGAASPRTISFLARKTLFDNPVFGFLIRKLNAFPLDREGDPRSAIRMMRAQLAEGACVVMFPEGTRTRDGRLQPLRRGIGMLSVKTGSPVLPIYIGGSFQSWPRRRKLPRPARLRVEAGTLITPADATGDRLLLRSEEERVHRETEEQLKELEAAWRSSRGLPLDELAAPASDEDSAPGTETAGPAAADSAAAEEAGETRA